MAEQLHAAPRVARMDTSLPSPRLPAPDPVRGQCAALVQGLLGKHWKACQARRKEDTPTLATIPALPGDPSSSGHTCSAVSTLVSEAPSPRRGSSSRCPVSLPRVRLGEGSKVFPQRPRAASGLRRPRHQEHQKRPGCCGARVGRLAVPLVVCFLSVSGVLSSSSLLFTEPCCLLLLLLVLKLRQHLVGTGALPLASFHTAHPPLGARTPALWPLGAPGLDPQASMRCLPRANLCHTVLSLSHISVCPPGEVVQ